MKYRLIYTESYNERASNFLKRHPDSTSRYEKTLKLLELNPRHPSLRLHSLKGRLKELSSVSIDISYRITLELIFAEKEIILVNIGQHNQVY